MPEGIVDTESELELPLQRYRALRRAGALDLSSWRLALNGAETVDPNAVEAFCAAAAPLGFDARAASDEELREALGDRVENAVGLRRAQLLDEMFSAFAEPSLVDPSIVFDYPIEMSPLAKPRRGDPELAERFEVIVGGTELVNAFSELNDPIDQWDRFADQARARAAGDAEAQDVDVDYVRALEYGLPPTGGLGLGVDRLVMLLTGQSTIRDVLLYPVLRDVD